MISEQVKRILEQEFEEFKLRIYERLENLDSEQLTAEEIAEDEHDLVLKPLPENQNYRRVLDYINEGENYSSIARKLNVSITQVKRYYNWLVKNGYLHAAIEELSDRESEVVGLLFEQEMSINRAAQVIGCSVSNIISARDSAIRKGYVPPATEYMIKIVYPGIFEMGDNPTIGFNEKKKSFADTVHSGQKLFIYVTEPFKRLVGLGEVISEMNMVDGYWPYSFDFQWTMGPKKGKNFTELGLNYRVRPGDTLYRITNAEANIIISELNMQPDLTLDELDSIRNQISSIIQSTI